jgi:hypothetical protein
MHTLTTTIRINNIKTNWLVYGIQYINMPTTIIYKKTLKQHQA